MKKQVKVKSEGLAKALGVKVDSVMTIECCKKGVPLVKEWRNRIRDSKIDNCIEVLKTPKKEAIK